MAGVKRKRDSDSEVSFAQGLGDVLLQQNDLKGLRAQIQKLNALRENILETERVLDSTEGRRVLRLAKTIKWRYERYRAQAEDITKEIAEQPEILQNVLRAMVAKASLPSDHEVWIEEIPQHSDTATSVIKTELGTQASGSIIDANDAHKEPERVMISKKSPVEYSTNEKE